MIKHLDRERKNNLKERNIIRRRTIRRGGRGRVVRAAEGVGEDKAGGDNKKRREGDEKIDDKEKRRNGKRKRCRTNVFMYHSMFVCIITSCLLTS